MPEFLRLISSLREHMQAELTRSDVLRALIWPNAGILIALTTMTTASGPEWILKILIWVLCAFMGLYFVAYLYFAIVDPDALRSEKYKLQKIAIEHGLYGDSQTGLIEPNKTAGTHLSIEADAVTINEGSDGAPQ